MKLLITGGCGFIGTNFVKYILNKYPDYNIVNVDKLTYAGNLENHEDIMLGDRRHFFYESDIYALSVQELIQDVDAIINFAAETHVDRSIGNPGVFYQTNVMGTLNLLEAVRNRGIPFIQISTDEVYGQLGDEGKFIEETPLNPSSPYSASKASADMMVMSYYHTFGVNARITRCSNNYGPYQYPEKLIPLLIANALDDGDLPIYGNGLNVRDWIHVTDHCRAIDKVLHHGKAGEIYNVGSNNEFKNIEIATKIISNIGKGRIKYVKDRKGHDFRYAIDSTKIKEELGWEPQISFDLGLQNTIQWYKDNQDWWLSKLCR